MSIQGKFEHMNCWASQRIEEFPLVSTFAGSIMSMQTAVKKYTAALKLDWSGGNAQDVRYHTFVTSPSGALAAAHGRWFCLGALPVADDGVTFLGISNGGVYGGGLGVDSAGKATIVVAGAVVAATGNVALTV